MTHLLTHDVRPESGQKVWLPQLEHTSKMRQVEPIQFGCGFIYFFGFFGICFSFFVRASKMSCFTAFSREIDAFYTSPSTSPAPFSAFRPTSLASPTNRGQQNRKSSWRVDGVKKCMVQMGGHFSPCKKSPKSSGGVGGGVRPTAPDAYPRRELVPCGSRGR